MQYIENLPEGSKANIDNIPEMQGVVIVRISHSGTTIKLSNGQITVVSNQSPACLSDNQVVEAGKPGRKKSNIAIDIKLPEGNTPFTIKQLTELNEGLSIAHATLYVKDNCQPAGYAVRSEGQRGKAAAQFTIKQ